MIASKTYPGIFTHGKSSEDRINLKDRSPFTTPMVILMAFLINGLLLAGLSYTNKLELRSPKIEPLEPIILTPYNPPEPVQELLPREEPELPPDPTTRVIERTRPEYVPGVPPATHFDNLANTMPVPDLGPRSVMPPVSPDGIRELFEVDSHPILIRHIPPLYPFSAKRKGIEGQVTVRFVVDKTGMVLDPIVVKATPEGIFEESALRAVTKWRFRPAILSNKPVDVYVVVPLTFELN